jgi:hypothetical protein
MTPAKYVSEMYEHDDRVATVLIPRDAGSGHGDEPLKVEQRGWPVSAPARTRCRPGCGT